MSNNWAGTADVVDPHTFRRLARLDVDPRQGRADRRDPGRPRAQALSSTASASSSARATTSTSTTASRRATAASSTSRGRASPTSSRSTCARSGSPGASRSTATAPTTWRCRPTAAGCSSRPRRRNVIDVIDTRAHRIVARIPSGDQPHESNFSRDGTTDLPRLHRAGLHGHRRPVAGRHEGQPRLRDHRRPDAEGHQALVDLGQQLAALRARGQLRRPADGDRARRALRLRAAVVPARLRRVRPAHDAARRASRSCRSPGASRNLPRKGYLLDSAHHGLGINRAGHEALRGRHDVRVRGDRRPPHAARRQRSSPSAACPTGRRRAEDGRYCFVSVAGDDRVSVISFRTAREVAGSGSATTRSACGRGRCAPDCSSGGRRRAPRRAAPRTPPRRPPRRRAVPCRRADPSS